MIVAEDVLLSFSSTSREPNVPVQQSCVFALTPEVPNAIGKFSCTWFSRGMAVTVAKALLDGSALEVASIE